MNNNNPAPSTPNVTNPDRVCDTCGCFDAVQIGDRWLCVDCYEGCGSCCQEWLSEEENGSPDRKNPGPAQPE